ncbi:maf protein [Magnetococcus marinus MC-1]|uniref:dTTP/UTP pyrophosphatase n=1 Tax=Magnetococcus marinus (strain ATCC BAA-1437 / JCM 17883 / MC-1) TaxID=156889 RepID=A0LCZ6_MAGMM|nr:nucleoside triphosphate pyrophosphatase [Magnetococcus marinus]ABK45839.1 maf protein [Magnetococcus marinus MC-1]
MQALPALWWLNGEVKVCLASASPRRLELLRQVGLDPMVNPVACDETPRIGEDPQAYVVRLAREKARSGAVAGHLTLGSDTAVVVDGAILGKPQHRAEAIAMVQRLVGRCHEVMTGIAVCDNKGQIFSDVVITQVSMREVAPGEIAAYVDYGESMDKAGGYAIQGMGGFLVNRIEGSYSAVVGLPLVESLALLQRAMQG